MGRFFKVLTFLIVIVHPKGLVFSQCPTVSFSTTPEVCLEETLNITNSTVNGNTYEWDFNSGDMSTTPVASNILTDGLLNFTFDLEVVEHEGNWYGFAPGRTSNRIVRMDFGNNLSNTPVLVDLGGFSGLTDFNALSIYESSGEWYGIIGSLNSSDLVLLSFGNSLENVPTSSILSGLFSVSSFTDIEILEDDGLLMAFVVSSTEGALYRLDFGNSLENIPTVVSYDIPGVDEILDVSFIRECNEWYGLLTSFSESEVHKLSFGSDLESTPVVSEVILPGLSFTNAAHSVLLSEGGRFYGFVQLLSGQVVRLDYGTSLGTVTPAGTNFGDLGVSIGNVFGFSIVSENSRWRGFSIGFSSNSMVRLDFSSSSTIVTPVISEEMIPAAVRYTTPGSYQVTLSSRDANGHVSYSSQNVMVTGDTAPDISFTLDDSRCIANVNQFTSINTSGDIMSYSWDFDGDGIEDSSDPNPEFQFLAAGEYDVTLTVDAGVCGNRFSQSITIYPEPSNPSFEVIGSNFCIGDEITFNNLSTETGLEDVISYVWDFNGEGIATEVSPDFAFVTDGMKNITLQAIIPGCTTEVFTQQLVINTPPEVDFDFTRVCAGLPTSLINLSPSDDIVSYSWDFNDGFTSNIENPVHGFATEGTYPVTLTITDSNQCANTITRDVVVGQIPEPEISITGDLACSETILQFNDVTDNTISNTILWDWQITGIGSSDLPNPQFTFTESGN